MLHLISREKKINAVLYYFFFYCKEQLDTFLLGTVR